MLRIWMCMKRNPNPIPFHSELNISHVNHLLRKLTGTSLGYPINNQVEMYLGAPHGASRYVMASTIRLLPCSLGNIYIGNKWGHNTMLHHNILDWFLVKVLRLQRR